ncbi:hypothetical protein TNCV_2100571 [Trichonephila clavipes]|nr:hypothetical protein TNCV_2100571 [Trichonephila clavipes]
MPTDPASPKCRCQTAARPRIIKGKECRKLLRLVKRNRRQTVGQLTAQYIAGPHSSVSEHIVQWTLLNVCRHIIYQELVASMPKRVAAALIEEGDGMRYSISIHNILALHSVYECIPVQ